MIESRASCVLLKYARQTTVNSIHGTKTIKGGVNTLFLNGFINLLDISIAKVFAGVGVNFDQTKTTISEDTIAVNNRKAKLVQPRADDDEATQHLAVDDKVVWPHGKYHNLGLIMVRPYDLLTSIARPFDHAARSYNLAWTMSRPYDILPMMVKPHGHTMRYYHLVPTMERPYDNTLPVMAKLYSHVSRYYDLARTMTRSHNFLTSTARPFDHASAYNQT